MDNFYVGYMPNAPEGLRGWLKKVIVVLVLIGIMVSLIFLYNYEPSVNSTFEYGIATEMTGTIYKEPVPVIKVKTANADKTIVLVNFGKAGVSGILNDLEDSLGRTLSNYDITLSGSLIYYDGVTLLELTEEERSVIAIREASNPIERSRKDLGELTLTGELVDSKCFFGVMKPGFGKIHRSCAARCILGGIPVALATEDGGYYFVEGNEVLENAHLIGKSVQIDASSHQIDNLNYLNIKNFELSKNETQQGPLQLKFAGFRPSLDASISVCEATSN